MEMWLGARATVGKVVAATVVYALVHSVLASGQAKQLAACLFGRRQRNGWYRVFFLAQSVLTFVALVVYLLRLPNRVIYRAQGWLAVALAAGQVGGFGLAVYTAVQVGWRELLGITSARAWLRGDPDVPAEPEAQEPRLDANGTMHVSGPFKWSRHPLNLIPLAVLWLSPLMTVKLLAFNVVTTAYLVIGSLHEERRLLAAYGKPYALYRQSSVPFYVPMLRLFGVRDQNSE